MELSILGAYMYLSKGTGSKIKGLFPVEYTQVFIKEPKAQ